LKKNWQAVQIEFDGPPKTRLDIYLAKRFSFLSRTQLAKMIKEGLVQVDGDEAKPSFTLKGGEEIDIDLPPPKPYDIIPEDIPVPILYEEDDFLICKKPQNMLSHPAGSTVSGTLVNAMLHYCKGKLSGMVGVERPGIIHRLDKDTSGLMIIGKTDTAMKAFTKLFFNRKVDKRYYAIVRGHLKSDRLIINAPIGRDFTHRWKMAVSGDGREAISKVDEILKLKNHTLVEVKLVTGRTHQIRVHMQYVGHPVLCDPLYGGMSEACTHEGQLLHCGKLGFDFAGNHYTLQSTLPDYFVQAIKTLSLTDAQSTLNSFFDNIEIKPMEESWK
jgi:23S rRNA pseudouridine1911/1915/1917 synthase